MLKNFIILLTFTLFALQPVFAQDQEPRLEWYESFFQDKQKEADALLKQGERKLREAYDQRDKMKEAKARKEIGLIHLTRTHSYDLAMDYFIRALSIEDSLSLKKEQVFTYLAIANVFEEIGDYNKSAGTLEEAISLNEESNDIAVLVFMLNKLGEINAARGYLEAAFENFELVLKYQDEINQPEAEAEALFNLAHLYTKQGKYSEALSMHKRALAIWRSIRDRMNEAQSLNDIGVLYRFMKNDARVIANHEAAREIREAIDDKRGKAESLNNLGIFYYDMKQYDSAIAHLELGLVAGRDAQAQDQISKSCDYLTLCYKELEDYQKALEYKELYVAINELIQGENSDQKILETQNRYVMGKKQSQIEALESIRIKRERELEAQKKIRNFLFLAIALSLIVVALIVYLYLVKQRSNRKLQAANTKVNQQNSELQELNATKDKFFSIISHDLKGPLNSLTSFSNLLINYYESLSKEEVQMLAKDFDKSLKNLFALLENLLEWSRSQTGNIEFKPEVFDLAKLLEENHALLKAQAQNKKIDLVNTSNSSLNITAHKHSVNTVVRNLISNAIKFTPEGGTITCGWRTRGREVIVSIQDNGVGMSPEIMNKLFRIDTKHSSKGTAEEKGTGLGLILCKEFIEKNGGRIWVESEEGKGSIFSFSLPCITVNAPNGQVALT